MKVKFFADDHNARFVWHWIEGVYETEDTAEIENLKGLGLRFEEQESPKVKQAKAEDALDKAKQNVKSNKKPFFGKGK
jgi:hypothetical protein